MKEDEMSEKYKKALRLAAVMGCGFEGDAEDAAELLTLITGLESRIAELEATVEVGADIAKAYENRVSEIVALSNETVGKLNSRIAELREDNASLGDSNAWIKQNYEDLERDYGVMHEKMCARIAALKRVIEILENRQREVKNILIDKNLYIDSLYEEGYKLQQRIAELEAERLELRKILGWAYGLDEYKDNPEERER